MKRAGLLGVAMLSCLEFVVTAQVNNTEPPPQVNSTERPPQVNNTERPPQVNSTERPPNAPSYTPEQLFGRSPRGSSTNSDSSRESTPAQTLPSPPRATTPQLPAPSPACAPTTNTPPSATDTPPNASAFPGVSASQFPRAGVSADAFERPGVSADQLRTLIPGNETNTCAKQRDVVLHPDPERPPRPITSVTDEQ